VCVPLPAFYFDYNGVLNVAAFASGGRSPAVRVLVCIMCALFLFAVVAAPPAQAVAVETVAVFGLAAVLSAATAALGYKLSNSTQGKATLSQMCTDFASDAAMGAKVLVGMKIYGLQEGMKYIKMQVKNGKTYLDSKVVAWCQQYLGKHGVYEDGKITPNSTYSLYSNLFSKDISPTLPDTALNFTAPTISYRSFFSYFDLDLDHLPITEEYYNTHKVILGLASGRSYYVLSCPTGIFSLSHAKWSYDGTSRDYIYYTALTTESSYYTSKGVTWSRNTKYNPRLFTIDGSGVVYGITNFLPMAGSANTTGLLGGISGTDTLGKDYVNLTLDQILAGLKDWAKDWYDAGVESVLDGSVEGDIDLPLTVGAGAATLNPDVAADEELVYTPSFDLPLEDVRSGDTAASDVTAGQENAKTQTATADISENASVVSSLVSWALDYISPDKGIFSKFPLCVPYDAYLLACSALGVEARGVSDVTGVSPGDLDAVIYSADGVEAQSDFQPIISIKNDFTVDGKTYPIDLDIDLSPWEPLVGFFRNGVSLLVLAELIGSEYKRIRGH
jgi:hypothetical protein